VLGTPGNCCLDIRLGAKFLQIGHDVVNLFKALCPAKCELICDFFVLFRIGVAKTEIFELPLELPDTETICKGGKNIKGFLTDYALTVERERIQGPHVIQAVCHFYDHHADIVANRQKHLSQGFSQIIRKFQFREWGRWGKRSTFGRMLICAGKLR